MTLRDICEKIVDIEEGLMYGQINFQYDALMSAMKPGHPMEILDQILAEIYFTVMSGEEPSKGELENVIKNLKDFKKCFKVKELQPIIKQLNEYLSQAEKE